MSLKERLKEFITYLKIEIKAFETKCSLSNGFVNNAGHSIREKSLNQILEQYPELNKIWLVTGEGEMIIDRKAVKSNINAQAVGSFDYPMESDERVTDLGNGRFSFQVPLVPEYGYAGYISGWKDKEYIEELPKHIVIVPKRPQGEYLAIEVAGESMENWTNEEMSKQSIRDGEIVTGRNISKNYWTSRFHMHKFKDFIIVHKEGILVKRMIKHDVDKGIITLHSLNPNKDLYPDFDVDLREVLQILNIIHPVR